jgi:hypothetical protein
MGANTSVKCYLTKTYRRHLVGKITGKIEVNGKIYENTVNIVFKFDTVKGCATGTFAKIEQLKLTDSALGTYTVSAAVVSGGAGTTDWIKFQGKWENDTGSSKTIEKIELGISGMAIVYCEKTGLSDVVPDGEGIKYDWTITFGYSSGPLADAYRYAWAKMVGDGAFLVGNKVDFEDTGAASHLETATLKGGGTGGEDYHIWGAQYIATGAITIDKIQYLYDSGSAETDYVNADIVNKVMGDTDKLDTYITIQHI